MPADSSMRRKRDHAEMETIPGTSIQPNAAEVVDLTSSEDPRPSRKQRRVGPAPRPASNPVTRTLPMGPHDALLAELEGKYVILTATVISSSKINKKVTAVLSHLGHIDLFDQASIPGVMMLHARAGDASKLVTVMELAKRRIGELGQKWYQYNRVYESAQNRGGKEDDTGEDTTQTVIEDTMLVDGDEEDDAFEPTKTLLNLTLQDKPATETEKKNAYMSIFLSRVPMPELQAKSSFTLQTNTGQIDAQKK